MLVDRSDILLEQLGDQWLAQPKRLVDEPALDPQPSVLSLVENDFAGR